MANDGSKKPGLVPHTNRKARHSVRTHAEKQVAQIKSEISYCGNY